MAGSLPPPLGGVTVLFQYLLNDLTKREGLVTKSILIPIDSNAGFFRLIVSRYRVLKNILNTLPEIDVLTLHVPTNQLPFLGLFCLSVTRIFRKPFIIRKFGGSNYSQYKFLLRKMCTIAVNNADIYLAEAKNLVEAAAMHGARNAHWYPNNRPFSIDTSKPYQNKGGRFVYIGQIRFAKGIMELAVASEKLFLKHPIDIYGPFHDGISEDTLKKYKSLHYKGVLLPSQVTITLQDYDALILPTYHDGEGYPGVILEAFSSGIPVICTRWKYLPEIVTNDCGILIPPKDIQALVDAIQKLIQDDNLLKRLHYGALAQAEKFATNKWAEIFVDLCKVAIHAKQNNRFKQTNK